MKKWQIIAASVVLLIAAFTAWFLTTETGLRWGFQQVSLLLPGKLQTNEISGKLIGPITVKNIRFDQNGTVINIEKVYLDWRPARLLKGELNIARIDIYRVDLTLASKEPDNKQPSLPDIHLPLNIKIEQFKVTDIDIQQPEQQLHINAIALSANGDDDDIHINQFSLEAPEYHLQVNGNIQTSNHYEHELTIDWETSLLPDKTLTGNGTLKGSLENTQITHRITQPVDVFVTANVKNILKELSWQSEVTADNVNVRKLNSDWPDASVTLALQGTGDLSTADIDGLINGRYENIKQLNAKLKLTRQADNRIEIKQLKLTQTGNQAIINTQGHWQPAEDGGSFDLSFDWKKMQWPLSIKNASCKSGATCPEADNYIVKASHGKGQIKGKPEQYHLTLQSDSEITKVGNADLRMDAHGNLEGLRLNSLNMKTPAGSVLAQGNLAWTPEISWTASVSARDINPEKIDSKWPGQLQAEFISSGLFKSGKLTANVRDLNASGKLRDYPINLTGQFSWQKDQVHIDQLNLKSANSTLKVNGMIGKRYDLSFSLQSPNLSELYPDAAGELRTQGSFTGKTALPVINAELEGSKLGYADYKLGKIKGHLAADVFKWKQLDIDITANDIIVNDRTIKTATINVDKRKIQAQASADDLQIKVAMAGDIINDGWSGELHQASFIITDVTEWQLDQPSKITLSEKTIITDPLCWHDNREGKACITLEHKNNRWHAEMDIKRLSVVLFKYWLPELMTVEGLANINSRLTYHPSDSVLGNMDIHIDRGRVTYPLVDGGREEWDYRQAIMTVSLKPDGISANANVDIGESEKINADISLPGAKLIDLDPATQPVTANATINIKDLGLIAALVPEIDNLMGNVKVDVKIAGTLNKPTIAGELALQNGSVEIPKLGLNITGIKLQGYTTAMQQFNYQLEAKSGEGDIKVIGTTRLDRTNGWPTKLNITGNSFQVAKIPEAQIVVDPDLEVILQAKNIEVEGKLVIPYAKLQPKDISRAARVSEDVVIIGNEVEEMQKWQLTSRVRVILGERVSFYGYGFEGRLGGNLLLEDTPGQITKATGEINVPEGRYRAYGQRLDVEHGRMLFSGGPPTNPGLDLRAVRKVGNVTAGIKVKGSLKNPQLELFSVPSMGQTDVLSYLLLGRPIETANTEDGNIMARAALAMGLSGGDRIARSLGDRFGIDEMHVDSNDDGSQASLVLGRYLSPKLYVSYGVGLIEAVNTINIRYQISDKWQLTGESGLNQGADILYTIER